MATAGTAHQKSSSASITSKHQRLRSKKTVKTSYRATTMSPDFVANKWLGRPRALFVAVVSGLDASGHLIAANTDTFLGGKLPGLSFWMRLPTMSYHWRKLMRNSGEERIPKSFSDVWHHSTTEFFTDRVQSYLNRRSGPRTCRSF